MPRLITESDVRAANRSGARSISLPDDAIVTPLARDAATALGLSFEKQASRPSGNPLDHLSDANAGEGRRILALGSDHGGYGLKEALKPVAADLGWEILDVGTNSREGCDYPDFAYAVAHTVRTGDAALGIMIDGAGPGSAIACNKVDGIRAACVHDEFTAWNARAHNNANVMTMGSRAVGIEVCKRATRVFLETTFEGGRHARRVEKIAEIERHR